MNSSLLSVWTKLDTRKKSKEKIGLGGEGIGRKTKRKLKKK
jgi:hypothetical protein